MESKENLEIIKNSKGITLIALVVTIVVLIILAGVSINLVLGDNGILTKAKEAKEEYQEAEFKEKLQMAVQEYVINKNSGNNTSLEEILRQNLDENKIEEITVNGNVAVITYEGEKIKVDMDKGTVGKDTVFDIWDGTSMSEGLIGKGKEEEPYLIYNASDLAYMSNAVATGYSEVIIGLNEDKTTNNCNVIACEASYKLMSNIALNNVDDFENWGNDSYNRENLNIWKPIGQKDISTGSSIMFSGKFDGNGYEITGMYIESANGRNIGLFAWLGMRSSSITNATVKNLRVTNAYVSGDDNIGIISGYSNINNSIENCYSSGKVIGDMYVGGLIGYETSGKIINCTNNAEVKGNTYVGGITGYLAKSSSYNGIPTVENCNNKGEIYAAQDVGGIVGNGNSGAIKGCSNIAIIRSNNGNRFNYVGGIIGGAYDVQLMNCNNKGNITDMIDGNSSDIGGIAGYFQYKNDIEIIDLYNSGNIEGNANYVGGILGITALTNKDLTITLRNCKNTGTITSTEQYVGEIIGKQNGNVVIE